jgi:hypothetical protein
MTDKKKPADKKDSHHHFYEHLSTALESYKEAFGDKFEKTVKKASKLIADALKSHKKHTKAKAPKKVAKKAVTKKKAPAKKAVAPKKTTPAKENVKAK